MKKININDYVISEKKLLDLEYELIEKISLIRKEKGLSQRDLCEMINMKQPYLVKIENKKISPSINTLIRILSALDYKIELTKLKG